MRKKYQIIVTLLLLLACVPSYALNWKKFDAEVTNISKDGPKTTITLKDKKDKVFKVVYHDEAMLEKVVSKIIRFKNEFYGWREISFADISFLVFDNYLEVIVIPHEIIHQQNNLAKAVPAGITMMSPPDQDKMYYDFRIIKDNHFLRIDGAYLDEAELVNKLRSAYDYPLIYLQRGKSAGAKAGDAGSGSDENTRQALLYFLNEDWNGRPKSVPSETIAKVVELKQNNPQMTKGELWKVIKNEKVRITKRELELILIIYFNEFEN